MTCERSRLLLQWRRSHSASVKECFFIACPSHLLSGWLISAEPQNLLQPNVVWYSTPSWAGVSCQQFLILDFDIPVHKIWDDYVQKIWGKQTFWGFEPMILTLTNPYYHVVLRKAHLVSLTLPTHSMMSSHCCRPVIILEQWNVSKTSLKTVLSPVPPAGSMQSGCELDSVLALYACMCVCVWGGVDLV